MVELLFGGEGGSVEVVMLVAGGAVVLVVGGAVVLVVSEVEALIVCMIACVSEGAIDAVYVSESVKWALTATCGVTVLMIVFVDDVESAVFVGDMGNVRDFNVFVAVQSVMAPTRIAPSAHEYLVEVRFTVHI